MWPFSRMRSPTPRGGGRSARQRAKIQNQTMRIANEIATGMNARMQAFRSFPDELYSTGIKQGPNAGLFTSSNQLARQHSRTALNLSPVAASIIETISTLAIGRGLELEAQPIWRLIPEAQSLDKAARAEWNKIVEAKYNLWAKKKSVSYDETMNRYQQEQETFKRKLVDGEYFELYRYAANALKNPMTIQLIRAEDVRTPSGSRVALNNSEENGIEYDRRGAAVAYHIHNYATNQTVRVTKSGSRSGRVFVNHDKLGSNRRGIGIIAPMITELMKLGDYEVLELQAAVVNALYAVWVQTPIGDDGMPTLNAGIGDEQQTATSVDVETWIKDRKEINYNEGGLQIDALPGGYEIKSHDTKRPNVNFGDFMDQVKKNLASSVNIPISVIDKQFKNNYSASRGELILAWYEIEKYRFNQSMTNSLVYRMWLWGETRSGSIKAPGFFQTDEMQDAWSNAKWIGNQRPDIDPLRSVKAHVSEQNRGYKTGKAIAAERGGGDYDENLERVGEEMAKIAKNQSVFIEEDVNLEDN